MKNLTCNKCNWISFGIPRATCLDEIERFNTYFETLTPEQQQEYYGGKKSSIENYNKCHKCGGSHTDFRPTTEAEAAKIFGSTTNPILVD